GRAGASRERAAIAGGRPRRLRRRALPAPAAARRAARVRPGRARDRRAAPRSSSWPSAPLILRAFFVAVNEGASARSRAARPPLLIAYGLRELAAMVCTELDEEERLFFDPDLLRDDDVFAEVESG